MTDKKFTQTRARGQKPAGRQGTAAAPREAEPGGAAAPARSPENEGLFGWPWPLHRTVSGLYTWRRPKWQLPKVPSPFPQPPEWPVGPPPIHPSGAPSEEAAELASDEAAAIRLPILPVLHEKEEIRLDVDGRYPQMTASGTRYVGLGGQAHWVAGLASVGWRTWAGAIWYRDGGLAFPYTNVAIRALGSWWGPPGNLLATFSGGGAPTMTHTYTYTSRHFHPVEFEFDTVENTEAVTTYDTGSHPNRPETLPVENLSIEQVYDRAGFRVTRSGGDGTVPLQGAGANGTWSDAEMHDAMQTYWSRFADRAQWSLWVLFAARHDIGTGLGGIMFDDIGPNHRQGTAIFNDSFISQAPAGEANADAWVRRMRFWTACHEMGHAFNLAHSWQKSRGTPWITLADDPEARSFMNYPYGVDGGQTSFFADFAFRFSDPELLFMRHAPARFVQMGNADWFDHHGFRQARVSPEPKLRLEVRTNRERPQFAFLEPVVLELKLTNVSPHPLLVDGNLLAATDRMTVILKREGRPARQWTPYARYNLEAEPTALAPGRSLYAPLRVAAGINGWDLAEPGNYTVQLACHVNGEDLVSNPLALRVSAPAAYEEERVARDLFSEDVGRILAFGGSRFLTAGNEILDDAVERLPKSRVAIHARLALAEPDTCAYKSLELGEGRREMTSAAADAGRIRTRTADVKKARAAMDAALLERPAEAAETLGHVGYKQRVDRYAAWLTEQGERGAAAKCGDLARKTLSKRGVPAWVFEGPAGSEARASVA